MGYSLNAVTGEEVWSQATGKEVLYGLAIPEDYQETRCAAQTIHFMDELVMMEKIMSDMFGDEDGMEQIEESARKSGFLATHCATHYATHMESIQIFSRIYLEMIL